MPSCQCQTPYHGGSRYEPSKKPLTSAHLLGIGLTLVPMLMLSSRADFVNRSVGHHRAKAGDIRGRASPNEGGASGDENPPGEAPRGET